MYSRNCGIRGAADAAARQLLLLVLRGDGDVPGGHHWRLRGRQHGQVVVLGVQIGARSLHLDATLEAAVVAAVGGVLDLQVVDAVAGPEINSARAENGRKGRVSRMFKCPRRW